MKFRIVEDGARRELEGREAYGPIKRMMRYMGERLLMPEPPFTTKVRKRAIEALKRGEVVSDLHDENTCAPIGRITVRLMQEG